MLKRLVVGCLLFVGATAEAPAGTQDCTASLAPTGSPNEQAGLLVEAAKACVGQGDLDQAVSLFSQAIAKDPNNATAYLDRGTVYAKKGDVWAGIGDFNRVIALSPDMAEAWYSRGTVYVRLGQLESGIADLSEAIRRDPTMGLAYCNRGMAYMAQQKLDQALDDLTAGVKRDNPGIAFCYFALGKLFMSQKEYQQAVDSFSQGINRVPTSAEALAQRGLAYEQLGDRAKALADFHSALGISPSLRSAQAGVERLTPVASARCQKLWPQLVRGAASLTYDEASAYIENFKVADPDQDGVFTETEFLDACTMGLVRYL